MGVRLVLQHCKDHGKNPVQVAKHIVVPETQDTVTLSFEKFGSACIVIRFFRMLTTIQFHCQFTLDTGEINDVLPHGMLSPELIAIYLSHAQMPPQSALGIGWVAS